MAYANVTNDYIMPPSKPGGGAQIFQLADQGSAGTETDCGIPGYRFIRGVINIKSGLANTNTFQFRVRVDDNSSQASPELVYSSPVLTFVTNDVNVSQTFYGISQIGFRYFKITGTDSGGTAVYDAVVEVY